jgi:hypothetical protein
MKSKPHLKMLFVGAILSSFSLLESCTSPVHNTAEANTPEQVVGEYFLALERKDSSAILRLTPPESKVQEAVNKKISQYGGFKIQDRKISFSGPKPLFLYVKLQGVYMDAANTRKDFIDDLNIKYTATSTNKGRWYLSLEQDSIEKK